MSYFTFPFPLAPGRSFRRTALGSSILTESRGSPPRVEGVCRFSDSAIVLPKSGWQVSGVVRFKAGTMRTKEAGGWGSMVAVVESMSKLEPSEFTTCNFHSGQGASWADFMTFTTKLKDPI
eukprot:Protomagalhaensia_sp_Gyna_25__5841@NODE_86_length_5385_cov_126_707258_g66_i0_p7_GENE_NODE_86_length_5385_cov_126_707258_g66_i0NODE_86_length_5385_cov_126_707258_g66_i0_p7_ORF_typecomplete_len121_score13_04UPF0552/PF10574_9/0_12_NODE_86_length_5385_cov_126_707258_g66_i030343396